MGKETVSLGVPRKRLNVTHDPNIMKVLSIELPRILCLHSLALVESFTNLELFWTL